MSRNKAIDNDGRIVWCNSRKPINDPSWMGCGNLSLQSVPAGTCDRLFDPNRFKLCESGSPLVAMAAGATTGGQIGSEYGSTLGPEGIPVGAIAGGVIGTVAGPIINSSVNRESCIAKNIVDEFAEDTAYCPVPTVLINHPSKENAYKFGIICVDDEGLEREPATYCYSVKNETDCEKSYTLGVGVEEPYSPCKWNGDYCEPDTFETPCRFNETLMRTYNDSNFSWLKNNETPEHRLTFCDYNDQYGSYDPLCPESARVDYCPTLDRQTYDFNKGASVIYCGKTNNPVKCADSLLKVDALIFGENTELASCPCGYVESEIVENPDKDGCYGVNVGEYGYPCRYRKCEKVVG